MRRCILLVLLCSGPLHAVEPALGAADFRPSPARPIGYRGDGSGCFPGANPPDSWDMRTGANVRWCAPLPSYGCGAATAVGRQVFVQCNPDRLIAINAETGAIAWERRADHLALAAGDRAKTVQAQWQRAQEIHDEGYAVAFERGWLQFLLRARDAGGYPRRAAKDFYFNDIDPWNLNLMTEGQLTEAGQRLMQTDATTLAAWRARLVGLEAVCQAKGYDLPSDYGFSGSPFGRAKRNALPPEGAALYDELTALTKAVAPFGLGFESWATGYMSLAFQTPASDGQQVYATFSHGQAICCDLDGTVRWIAWTPVIADKTGTVRDEPGGHTRTNTSPILAEGKLIYLHRNNLIALDVKNGCRVWQVPTKDHCGHGFHRIIRVRHGALDVVVSSSGEVFRVGDGACLEDRLSGTITPLVAEGDVLVYARQPTGGAGNFAMAAFRLSTRTTDCLEVLWGVDNDNDKDHGLPSGLRPFAGWRVDPTFKTGRGAFVGGLLRDGVWIQPGGALLDAATGATLGQLQAADPRDPRGLRQIEVTDDNGQDLVAFGGGRFIVGSKFDATGSLVCRVQHDGGQVSATLVSAGNITISALYRDLYALTLTPTALGAAVRAGHMPTPRFRYANKTPHGDALLIRTADALWCIGTKP